jgi:7-carboxy-7-deazaguanine synthase
MAKKIKVNEIFYSIQGEGINQGLPTIFVRLSGCNLRCTYCDSMYAYEEGEYKGIQEILLEITKFNCKRICITGGEPLSQKETLNLVDNLENYLISIETNGSIDVSPYTDKVMLSIDIKCPSSESSDKMRLENLSHLTKKDEVKFVVMDEKDLKFSYDIIRKYDLTNRTNVVVSPVFGSDYGRLVNLILREGLDIRFGMQMHKFIWSPDRRGV